MASEDMCPCDYCTGQSSRDYIKKQEEEIKKQEEEISRQNIKKVRWGRRKKENIV
jgi:hypothetical protein